MKLNKAKGTDARLTGLHKTFGFGLAITAPFHDYVELQELRDEIIRRVNAHDALIEALKRSQELFDKALPQFNWAKSALGANAIRLLNEVPIEVAKALAEASETRTEGTPDAKKGTQGKDSQ